ncbi:MAG: hypothetical protein JSV34_05430 [Candidatus Omnitrophota bacterium]|nr:MAG: hypothetical protein JSV34_05430 [Candidatus Omnitrophota bacterium]
MRQRQYIVFLLIAISLLTFLRLPECLAQKQKNDWIIKKGSHFIIYHAANFSSKDVRQLLRKAESYYSSITEEFGFRRFNFWTWDNRCKIYLYSSSEDYYNNTKQPQWSRASVHVKERAIHAFSINQYFLDTILPHEMGHLIFREFVGYYTSLPLWLDEGIATFVERDKGENRLARAREIVRSFSFISLKGLTEVNSSNIKSPDVFYAEAASIIEFLLREYGREKFVEYCRYLRDKKDWYEGLLDVYGFTDLYDMNNKWMDFLLD